MPFLQVQFFSEVLGRHTSMNVILPQPRLLSADGGVQYPHEKFPTLYLLHGLSDDHSIWMRRTAIERYVVGRNLAVVMPDGQRGFYTDQVQGYRYFTFLSEELPAICEAMFPLSTRRADRFAAGLSMGGYGAMKLGLRCPNRYAAVASLSGAVDMVGRIETLLETGDPQGDEMVNTFGLPGTMRGGENDLFAAGKKLVRRHTRPDIYMFCGTEDFLFEDNRRFHHAFGRELSITYEEGPGGHTWDVWDDKIQTVLDWLPLEKP